MKCSIAISTYEANGKGKELLSKNMSHIFIQDYDNIEIVISDQSKDNVIEEYIKECREISRYPIIYVRDENLGNSSQNINNAINHCSGDIIKIIFMDDFLSSKTSITKIVNEFKENPDIKWLVNSYDHTKDYITFYRVIYPRYNKFMALGNNTIGCPSGLTIHSSVTERFNISLKWLMDCEYYYRLYTKYGEPHIYTKDVLVSTLLHDNQVTNTAITTNLINREKQYVYETYKDIQELFKER